MTRNKLSIALTLALIVGVGIAIYQSARDQLEKKVREEIAAAKKQESVAPKKQPQPLSKQLPLENAAIFPHRTGSSMKSGNQPLANRKKSPEKEVAPLVGYFEGILSEDTTLHAIGVYEGENPSGIDDPPWWKNCMNIDREDSAAMMECHRKYAGITKQKIVTVKISYSKKPIILALMAYDPVKWDIDMTNGVKLEGVILAGYHSQDIMGIPTSTRVIAYNHKTPGCVNCMRGEGYFYAYKQGKEYKKAAEKLLEITGKQISSFQGSYKSHKFNLTNNSD